VRPESGAQSGAPEAKQKPPTDAYGTQVPGQAGTAVHTLFVHTVLEYEHEPPTQSEFA
jgi:hypothetical protein